MAGDGADTLYGDFANSFVGTPLVASVEYALYDRTTGIFGWRFGSWQPRFLLLGHSSIDVCHRLRFTLFGGNMGKPPPPARLLVAHAAIVELNVHATSSAAKNMIARRSLLLSIPTLAAISPIRAFGVPRCLPPHFGIRTCEVSLPYQAGVAATQNCDSWCWAACIQMIFAISGKAVPQEKAVTRLFNSYKCEGADVNQIVQTINGEWRDSRGMPFQATGRMLPKAGMAIAISSGDNNSRAPGYIEKMWATSGGAREIISELDRGRPLINLALGHATVIVGVTFQQDEIFSSRPIGLSKIVILDPWPTNQRLRELTAKEISQQFLAIAVDVR